MVHALIIQVYTCSYMVTTQGAAEAQVARTRRACVCQVGGGDLKSPRNFLRPDDRRSAGWIRADISSNYILR